MTRLSETVAGRTRTWTVVAPPGPRRGILVVLHGVGGTGTDMRGLGFESLARQAGTVLAYPDALVGWNDQRPGADPLVEGDPVDDVAFLRRVLVRTAEVAGTEPGAAAIAGLSNGGIMAALAACHLSELVQAVALVAATAPQGFAERCRPAKPVSVVLLNGAHDRRVPPQGGAVGDWNGKRRGFVASADEVFAFWADMAGCPASSPAAVASGVTGRRATGCSHGSVLQLLDAASSHEWPQRPEFDATRAVWEFLATSLRPAP